MTREEKEQTGKYVLQMAKLLEDGCYQQEMLLKAVRIIDEALEQEQRWIPCSERLPEENVDVLVVVEFPNGKDGTLQRIEISSFGLIYPLSSEKGWITNNFTRIASTEVIAWMPLPKPYEPQESEVEDGNDD